jgi:DNA modification methylase
LGSEPTPALFIEHLVTIFDEVRRVLRPDGLCFVNIGDSYAGSGKGPSGSNGIGDQEERQGFAGSKQHANAGSLTIGNHEPDYRGIPAKNLILIPQKFAIGMQDRGWIVRSCISWCKTSAMPESVRDRPTSAWEPIWMFAKSARYFYDADAVRQPAAPRTLNETREARSAPAGWSGSPNVVGVKGHPMPTPEGGANLRNYWLLSPEPSRLEHYAGFPTEIPRRCILAGTSEKGACPVCGAPWGRVVERTKGDAEAHLRPKHLQSAKSALSLSGNGSKEWAGRGSKAITTGWAPSCTCDAGTPVPCVVLDPFGGSGTTGLVADRLGRDAILVELNPDYAEMSRRRLESDAGSLFGEPVAVETAPRQLDIFGEAS